MALVIVHKNMHSNMAPTLDISHRGVISNDDDAPSHLHPLLHHRYYHYHHRRRHHHRNASFIVSSIKFKEIILKFKTIAPSVASVENKETSQENVLSAMTTDDDQKTESSGDGGSRGTSANNSDVDSMDDLHECEALKYQRHRSRPVLFQLQTGALKGDRNRKLRLHKASAAFQPLKENPNPVS